jgi:hypothetical protein
VNDKTEEYIQLLSTFDFVKQLNPDEATEKFQARMDELWYSFSEEEVEWVENWIIEQKKWVPLAPESLDMVDVEVKIGECSLPRKSVKQL